jgi:hypothetical protein
MSTFWIVPSSPASPAVKWEAKTSAFVRSQPFPTKILVQGSSQSPEPEPIVAVLPKQRNTVPKRMTYHHPEVHKQEPGLSQMEIEMLADIANMIPLSESKQQQEEDKPSSSSFLDDNLSSPERLKLFNDIYSPMVDDKPQRPHSMPVDMCQNLSCRCWNVASPLFT